MKWLVKVVAGFDSILNFLAYAAIMLIAIAMVAVCVDVIARYFLNRPIEWIFEVSEYLLLFLCFLGAPWVLKRERHVKIDMLLTRLNAKNRAFLCAITSILGAAICFVIAWYSAWLTLDHFQRGVRSLGFLQIPKSPLLAIIPIGNILLCIQFVKNSCGYFRDWKAL